MYLRLRRLVTNAGWSLRACNIDFSPTSIKVSHMPGYVLCNYGPYVYTSFLPRTSKWTTKWRLIINRNALSFYYASSTRAKVVPVVTFTNKEEKEKADGSDRIILLHHNAVSGNLNSALVLTAPSRFHRANTGRKNVPRGVGKFHRVYSSFQRYLVCAVGSGHNAGLVRT